MLKCVADLKHVAYQQGILFLHLTQIFAALSGKYLVYQFSSKAAT
jgi:hypothetical protein